MGLANAWQYFEGGVRFPFLAPPVLSGPVRPFYGVYAYPHPVTHFDMLIEWLRNSSNSRTHSQSALDVGTGCGVVALMLRRIAGIPDVVATDVSPNAVYGAREELKRQGLDDVQVLCSDLFTGLDPDRKFDLVVFNPPWLPLPASTANEPPRTVLGPRQFLFRRPFPALLRRLTQSAYPRRSRRTSFLQPRDHPGLRGPAPLQGSDELLRPPSGEDSLARLRRRREAETNRTAAGEAQPGTGCRALGVAAKKGK